MIPGKFIDTKIEFFESHLVFKNIRIDFLVFHDDIDFITYIKDDYMEL